MSDMNTHASLAQITAQLIDVAPEAEEILESEPFRRLENISFLGAIDAIPSYFFSDSKMGGSRQEHSIWVAYIALQLTDSVGASKNDQKKAIFQALTHDIGHGPLSHSTERFFQIYCNIDHHTTSADIVDNLYPSINCQNCKYTNNYVNIIFDSKINADTLEGISRSSRYFSAKSDFDLCVFIENFCVNNIDMEMCDAFWDLKNTIYKDYIYASYYAYDNIIEKSLERAGEKVSPRDFQLDDSRFIEKYFLEIQETLDEMFDNGWEAPPKRSINRADCSAVRDFVIDKNVLVERFEDVNERYKTVMLTSR